MQKITTFLTYDGKASEAAKLYTSIFAGSKITSENPMSVTFELEGQTFIALNGGPSFTFSQGISLFVSCETQEEVDTYWSKLIADGGKEGRCGWCTDRFGVSWQVIPKVLGQLLSDPDRARAKRAIDAMMTMNKIDIAGLKRAADQS